MNFASPAKLLCLKVFLCWIFLVHWLLAKSDHSEGRNLFLKHCAECHGELGEGVEDEYSKPLLGDWPLSKLINYVDETMPDYDPKLVTGKEAEIISRYIYESFYLKPELFSKKEKIHLSRLTNRQFRQSVADLFSQFEGQPVLGTSENGLKGQYFKAEGMNKRKEKIAEQTDPTIDFNFGQSAPFDGLDPQKFSVYWEGSIFPRESGWYDFYIQSSNGFQFSINSRGGSHRIDAKVGKGSLDEKSTKVYLLGGRPYPIRLSFYKFNDPNASIELSWKTPLGEREIIPSEYFFTQNVAPSFIPQQNLPPDDASHGYDRGLRVDSSWDEAITFAALEAAKYAGEKFAGQMINHIKEDEKKKEKVISICENFVRLAFREKLSSEELDDYVHSKFTEGVPWQTSVEKVVLRTLKSPRFLYPELQTFAKKDADPYVLAAKLALYLWDSLPGVAIHQRIDLGHLSNPKQAQDLARIMLNDPRSIAKYNDFMVEWLDMRNKELPSLSTKLYPDFSPTLALDLRRSLMIWVEKNIWKEKGTWQSFLSMDKIHLNQRMADFYGVDSTWDRNQSSFKEMDSSLLGREGLHTHPYVLASHSYSEESSPIHRGIFTSRRILGRSLRPPAEAVSFSNADFDPSWTMRQKVEELTKSANCMSCHDLINPTGFVLEGYDASGRNRSLILGKPIDLKVDYMDSTGAQRKFQDPKDLLEHALNSSRPAKSFVNELLKYLAKQPPSSFDRVETNGLSKKLKNDQLSIPDLYGQLGYQAALDCMPWKN
jgi:hypothetical protein